MIEDNKKYRIAELERQKISIEDELQFTTDVKRVIVLEEQLYEINDTIKKKNRKRISLSLRRACVLGVRCAASMTS